MTDEPPVRMTTDVHVRLDRNSVAALDNFRRLYANQGVRISRSSAARLAIQTAASQLLKHT